MLIRGTRTLDSFLSAIAMHLSPSDGEYVIDPASLGYDKTVDFGPGDWGGHSVSNPGDVIPFPAVALHCIGLREGKVATVERAIAILEGLKFMPNEEPDLSEDNDDEDIDD